MFFGELVSIAAIPSCDAKYITSLTNYYSRMADIAVPELRVSPEIKNGRPVLDWKTASDLMLSTLAVKKRLEHGGR